jgi:hypothetical protein
MTIDVGKEFYHRLANRDEHQGDGANNAIQFRKRYLSKLDNQAAWTTDSEPIVFDFRNVKKIGPSFANEAFGYFTKYATPEAFYKKVQFINISNVQQMIIDEELQSGYSGR